MKFTIRLREGKDDGLIKWINSLEEGSRSRVVRNILKTIAKKSN